MESMKNTAFYLGIVIKVCLLVVIFNVLMYFSTADSLLVSRQYDKGNPVAGRDDVPIIGNPVKVSNPVPTPPMDTESESTPPSDAVPDSTPSPDDSETGTSSDSSDEPNNEGSPGDTPDNETPESPGQDTEIEPIPVYMPSDGQVAFNNIVWGGNEKTVYLTFDDGPTPKITTQILDILNKEGVKATFFVIGENADRNPSLIKKAYNEGHGIANHTYTHRFEHIYANVDNYVEELEKTEATLKSILGEDKQFKVTRFPGGSFGEKLVPYRNMVNKKGYGYIDWNSLNGDAESAKNKTKKELVSRLKETVKGQTNLVVLMHDAPKKNSTIEALPEIIDFLKKLGYKFELLPWTR